MDVLEHLRRSRYDKFVPQLGIAWHKLKLMMQRIASFLLEAAMRCIGRCCTGDAGDPTLSLTQGTEVLGVQDMDFIQSWADKSAKVSNGWYYSYEAKLQHLFHLGDCLHLYFSRYCDVSSIYEEYRMEQAKRNAIAELRSAGLSLADIAKVLKYPRTTVYDVCK